MAETNLGRNIIVIGGSAGAITPLRMIVANLPRDLPAAVFVVLHMAPGSPGLLPDILNHWNALPAIHAHDGDEIRPSTIYVAPPDHHLLVHRGVMHVARGPRENRFRPAIDPLFRSAARAYGPQVMGLLLSGGLNDGTYGLMFVKKSGGIAMVQDPQDAEFPEMIDSALEHVEIDYTVPAPQIAPLLTRLAREPLGRAAGGAPAEAKGAALPNGHERPADVEDPAESEDMGLPHRPANGHLVPMMCPECGGSLWELKHGKLLRYRCHEGHAYTAETLLSQQNERLEEALWTALRALDENAELVRRMARRARESNRLESAKQFEEHVAETEARAALIRSVVMDKDPPPN